MLQVCEVDSTQFCLPLLSYIPYAHKNMSILVTGLLPVFFIQLPWIFSWYYMVTKDVLKVHDMFGKEAHKFHVRYTGVIRFSF